jgi:hypothetical protein
MTTAISKKISYWKNDEISTISGKTVLVAIVKILMPYLKVVSWPAIESNKEF